VSDSADTVGASSQSASLAKPFFAALSATSIADATAAAKSVESGSSIGADGFLPAGCATVVASGASVTTTFDGCSGAFGLASIDVTLDVAGGGHCVTISGATHGWVIAPERGIDTVIDGYRVCPAECPLAGTITSTGHLAHRTITVAFDGSSFAHVTAPKRGTFDVPLMCDD